MDFLVWNDFCGCDFFIFRVRVWVFSRDKMLSIMVEMGKMLFAY